MMLFGHVFIVCFFFDELELALYALQTLSEVDESDMAIDMMFIPEGHDAEWTLELFNIGM